MSFHHLASCGPRHGITGDRVGRKEEREQGARTRDLLKHAAPDTSTAGPIQTRARFLRWPCMRFLHNGHGEGDKNTFSCIAAVHVVKKRGGAHDYMHQEGPEYESRGKGR